MNLQEAEAQKRSSELDAKEAFIDSKQKILDEAPITLKVYDSRVAASEARLSKLNKDIEEVVATHEGIVNDQKLVLFNIQISIDNKSRELSNFKVSIKNAEDHLEKIVAKEKEVKSQIEARETYKKEQEELISSSIEKGNERLLELQDEIGKEELELREVTGSFTVLSGEYDVLVIKYSDLEQGNLVRIDEFDAEIAEYTRQLKILRDNITKESARYKKVTTETDSKLSILREKEESLMAKQDAIRLDRQELETEKRRFNSTKSLYQ